MTRCGDGLSRHALLRCMPYRREWRQSDLPIPSGTGLTRACGLVEMIGHPFGSVGVTGEFIVTAGHVMAVVRQAGPHQDREGALILLSLRQEKRVRPPGTDGSVLDESTDFRANNDVNFP